LPRSCAGDSRVRTNLFQGFSCMKAMSETRCSTNLPALLLRMAGLAQRILASSRSFSFRSHESRLAATQTATQKTHRGPSTRYILLWVRRWHICSSRFGTSADFACLSGRSTQKTGQLNIRVLRPRNLECDVVPIRLALVKSDKTRSSTKPRGNLRRLSSIIQ